MGSTAGPARGGVATEPEGVVGVIDLVDRLEAAELRSHGIVRVEVRVIVPTSSEPTLGLDDATLFVHGANRSIWQVRRSSRLMRLTALLRSRCRSNERRGSVVVAEATDAAVAGAELV